MGEEERNMSARRTLAGILWTSIPYHIGMKASEWAVISGGKVEDELKGNLFCN